jgi:acyl dehydratase
MARANAGRPGDPSLPVLDKEIAFDKVLVFSGYPSKTIHTDREVARARGLPDVVAQGLQTYAYMCEWLVEYFGKNWLMGGKLAVSFLSIVQPGDVVSVKAAMVGSREVDGGSELALEIWCENQRGETIAAGTAQALAPSRIPTTLPVQPSG